MKHNIFARCEKECVTELCDDYGADICVAWHTEEEHFSEGHKVCGKAAFLSHGCAICQEIAGIHFDVRDGGTAQRECDECGYLFDLDSENPYGEVLYDEDVGVHFVCRGCAYPDVSLDVEADDLEDEIDRMAELMEMGRL